MLRIMMGISETPPVVNGSTRVAAWLCAGRRDLRQRVDIVSLAAGSRLAVDELHPSSMSWCAPHAFLSRPHDYVIVHIPGSGVAFSDVALLHAVALAVSRGSAVAHTHYTEITPPLPGHHAIYVRLRAALLGSSPLGVGSALS